MTNIEDKLARLKFLKDEITYYEAQKRALTAELAAEVSDYVLEDYAGKKFKVTLRQKSNTPHVNLPLIQAKNPMLHAEITKQVLDTKKFSNAIDAGLFSMELLDEAIAIVDPTPYYTFTELIEEDDE